MFNLKDISKIKGYSKLTVNAKMFEAFFQNFLNAWGIEARETIKPLKVEYVEDAHSSYLRFEYKLYGKKEWLHVKSPRTWY